MFAKRETAAICKVYFKFFKNSVPNTPTFAKRIKKFTRKHIQESLFLPDSLDSGTDVFLKIFFV